MKILSEEDTLFDGPCRALFVPSSKGEMAILPFHTPLIGMLTEGVVSVLVSGQLKKVDTVESGVVHVAKNRAIVLVNL